MRPNGTVEKKSIKNHDLPYRLQISVRSVTVMTVSVWQGKAAEARCVDTRSESEHARGKSTGISRADNVTACTHRQGHRQ